MPLRALRDSALFGMEIIWDLGCIEGHQLYMYVAKVTSIRCTSNIMHLVTILKDTSIKHNDH